jgi:hypothetical protein
MLVNLSTERIKGWWEGGAASLAMATGQRPREWSAARKTETGQRE